MPAEVAPAPASLDVSAPSFQPGRAKFVKPAKDLRGANVISKYAAAALRSERAQVDAQCVLIQSIVCYRCGTYRFMCGPVARCHRLSFPVPPALYLRLSIDVQKVLEGGCVYLPAFLCPENDNSILLALTVGACVVPLSSLFSHLRPWHCCGAPCDSPPAPAASLEEENQTRALRAHNFPLPRVWFQQEELKNQPGDSGMIDWSRHLKHENPDFSPTFNSIVKRLSDHFDVGARGAERRRRCPDGGGCREPALCQRQRFRTLHRTRAAFSHALLQTSTPRA